jgi:hypothetical protein
MEEFEDYTLEQELEVKNDEIEYLKNKVKDYQTVISFISDDLTGDVRPVIETISELEMMEVIGIVDGTMVVKDNELFIEAEVPNLDCWDKKTKYLFDWQPNHNNAVYQRTEFEDSYYGYMLFPKYGGKKYLCVFYRC